MPRRPAMPVKRTNSPAPSISNIALLRQQWKWAAFSLFFYTFSPLFAMSDVTLNVSFNSRCSWPSYSFISQDIESDLIHATSDVLPRIMHRLLYTLSYDRKVSYVFFSPSHFYASITVILALTIGKQPFANNTASEILKQILLGRNRKYTPFPTRTTIFNLLKGRRLLR
jgi:hypothetical protein